MLDLARGRSLVIFKIGFPGVTEMITVLKGLHYE